MSKNKIVDNQDGTSTVIIDSAKYGEFKVTIDTAYVRHVEGYTWSIARMRRKFYAVTGMKSLNRKAKTTYMHALLNGTPPGLVTDHIDDNSLNNRLSNLRSVTIQENLFNQPRAKGYIKLGENRFRACIMLNQKYIHIGIFKTAIEARAAYIKAKLELHIIK
jgi:hypothetical protein